MTPSRMSEETAEIVRQTHRLIAASRGLMRRCLCAQADLDAALTESFRLRAGRTSPFLRGETPAASQRRDRAHIAVGAEMRRIRLLRRIKPGWLAWQSNVSEADLLDYECGRRRLDAEDLLAIAGVLDITLGEFFGHGRADGPRLNA
jgi:hypothetical protein